MSLKVTLVAENLFLRGKIQNDFDAVKQIEIPLLFSTSDTKRRASSCTIRQIHFADAEEAGCFQSSP
jgi:hypothetical protein